MVQNGSKFEAVEKRYLAALNNRSHEFIKVLFRLNFNFPTIHNLNIYYFLTKNQINAYYLYDAEST